jgi:enediyne biosynthesis protein E4
MSSSPRIRAAVVVLFVGLLGFAVWAGRRPEGSHGEGALPTFGFRLVESAKACGIDFVHHAPELDPKLANIMPHAAGMGAAVSVCDANGDGWADLYATNSAFGFPNALFLNRGDGTFREAAGEAGLADVNGPGRGASMGSIWADYDGDGKQDCFLYKWGYPQLFHNDGNGKFSDVTEAAGLRRWMNSNGACWIDFDRDGLTDLYVTGYFREDVDLWHLTTTKIMQESFEFAKNGGHNYLFRNVGGGRFEDVTAKVGGDSTRWTLAVVAADFNGDGWSDLYLANDYGPEEYFENLHGERFERREGVGLDESSKSGMAVAVGDFENDGRLGVYVTNISKSGYLFQGDNLRINRVADQGWFQNIADGVVADCGWAWGAQFGDLNNDGRADLYVVNGFISASQERDYWYGMSKIASATSSFAEDAAAWPPMEDRSLSGYERSRVLVNQGRARFLDAAGAVGADDLHDGRAVAFADFRHVGCLDVAVANQRGPLLLYRNEVDPARGWIGFVLAGAPGNTSAVGAEVTLFAGGSKQKQTVLAGSGFCAQNDLALHFGLGAAAPERAVVRWPSGVEQTVTDLRKGEIQRIEEPAR